MNKFKFAVLLVLCCSLLGISTLVHAQEEVTLTAWTHDQLYIEVIQAFQ